MSSLAVETHPYACNVSFNEDSMLVNLVDGRTLIVPLIWFTTLSNANSEQLNNWQLIGGGSGIHWPDLDEDLSINGLLIGNH